MTAQRKAKKKAASTKKTKAKKKTAKKAPAKKKAAKKKTAKKAPAKKKTAKKKTAKKAPAKKKTTKKVAAKKAPRKSAKPSRATAAREPKKAKRATPRRKRPPLDLAHFRTQLQAKHKELLQAYITSKGDSRNRQADGTEDYIDYAVSSYDREFLLSLSELEQRELGLVEEALKRIEARSFGACTQCSRHIAAKRLEVQPWARYCLRCQELADQGLGRESFEAAIAEDDLDSDVDEDVEYDEDESDEDSDESEEKDIALA